MLEKSSEANAVAVALIRLAQLQLRRGKPKNKQPSNNRANTPPFNSSVRD